MVKKTINGHNACEGYASRCNLPPVSRLNKSWMR